MTLSSIHSRGSWIVEGMEKRRKGEIGVSKPDFLLEGLLLCLLDSKAGAYPSSGEAETG